MIVALTGGTGFLGAHVLRRLVEAGHEVRALTRRPRPPRDHVFWIHGALDDEPSLVALCTGADAIVHVAGVTNAPDASAFDAANRVGTLAVLHAAEAARVDRFVHISSLAAREPGLSNYGASKRAGEDAVVTSTLDWRVVRPPAIYGPGETEMLDMFRLAKRGFLPLPPGGYFSIVHVDDMARLIVALLGAAGTHAIYEADDGRPGGWAHKEFAEMLGASVGTKPFAVALPKAILRLGARIDGLVRGKTAMLTPDRVGYLCHPDWTVDEALRPPPSLWTPAIATPTGLRDAAADYTARGLL